MFVFLFVFFYYLTFTMTSITVTPTLPIFLFHVLYLYISVFFVQYHISFPVSVYIFPSVLFNITFLSQNFFLFLTRRFVYVKCRYYWFLCLLLKGVILFTTYIFLFTIVSRFLSLPFFLFLL